MIIKSVQKKMFFLFLFITLASSIMFQTIESKIDYNLEEDITLNYVVSDAFGITEDSYFANYSSSGNGTESNPFIIENYLIESNYSAGIFVEGTTAHFIIRNCLVAGYDYGIFIYNVSVGTAQVINNTCEGIVGGYGILAVLAENITITDNTCRNNEYGLIIDSCSGARVSDNRISFTDDPFCIYYSPYSYIFNNTVEYGEEIGMLIYQGNYSIIENNAVHDIGHNLYFGRYGIQLNTCHNLTVRYNTLTETGEGFYLWATVGTVLTDNIILRCSSYGLRVSWNSPDWPSENNTYHHNYFIENSWGDLPFEDLESQAFDRGVRNEIWYDVNTNVGNYWSEYTGSGSYEIESSETYYDPFPMIVDDSDNDGLDDIEELYIYNTNMYNNDTDLDLLLDGEEVFDYLTNPLQFDSDFDGLGDGEEVLIYNTSPTTQDTDQDGLSDGEEIFTYTTNPRNQDSEGDSMSDGWEVFNDLNPLIDDSSEDPDFDGLVNLEEYEESTSPLNNDTDGDSLLDGEEVYTYFCSPLYYDSDFDGISDGLEVLTYGTDPTDKDSDDDKLEDGDEIFIYFTSPTDTDTDQDGCDDYWEVKYNFDPLDGSDANSDIDQDGLTNIEEYEIGTLPRNWDTDEDGFSDGLEVRKGFDPLLITDHPMERKDVIKLVIGIGIGSLAGVSLVLYILVKKKIIRFKK